MLFLIKLLLHYWLLLNGKMYIFITISTSLYVFSNTIIITLFKFFSFLFFLDEVGIDISNHVGAFMSKADLGVRMQGGNTELMSKMVEKNWLGRKTGKGFYMYPAKPVKGAKKELNPELVNMLKELTAHQPKNAPFQTTEDLQMRMISRFVNEAAFCLQDGIIRSPVDGKIFLSFYLTFFQIVHPKSKILVR